MLSGKNVIGLPVIAVDRGAQIDRVQDLVLDRSRKAVAALLIERQGWFGGKSRVLPLRAVQAIGPSAVLVHSAGDIVEAENVPEIQHALDQHAHCTGARVVTFDGRNLGTVKDIEFDEHTGAIGAFEVSGGVIEDVLSGRSVVPADSEMVVGEGVVIVHTGPLATAENAATPGNAATTGNTVGVKMPESGASPFATQPLPIPPVIADMSGEVRSPPQMEKAAEPNRQAAAGGIAMNDESPAAQDPDADLVGLRTEREVRAGDKKILGAGDAITFDALEKARQADVMDKVHKSAAKPETIESTSNREGA